MDFTNAEKTDMVLLYGEAQGNATNAQRLWAERFPQRRLPNSRTFTNMVQHLRDFGSFKMNTRNIGRQREDRILDAEEEILQQIEDQPQVSTRRLAAQVGVSHFVVWRTLKEQGLYPYHVQKVQALQPEDLPRRVAFCEWLLNQDREDHNFVANILATDEAGFTRNGIFNLHNTHIWADENPHAIQEHHFQRTFSINVWVGIVGGRLVGPHMLPNRLTGNLYLNFLENDLPQLMDDIPIALRAEMWYLHDGAPVHNARQVTEWMNNTYRNRWIGRSGPILWPPRSPDLNPCDFYVWGHMKQLVYATPVETEAELRQRVHNAGMELRNHPEILNRIRHNWIRRANACIINRGRHFEQIL